MVEPYVLRPRPSPVVALLLLALGGLGGCTSFAPTVREPMRIGNLDDADAAALGLVAGVTTLDEARATLHARGFTGVAESVFAHEGGAMLAALGADYQSDVHLFRDGRYLQSVPLPSRGFPPYGLVLRMGADDAGALLLALYRDPLGRAEQPPAIQSYRERDGRFVPAEHASLDRVVRRHGGMTSPLLVGGSLSDGLLLVARDRDGVMWDRGYLLRPKSGALELVAMPMTSALRCSCVDAYTSARAKTRL